MAHLVYCKACGKDKLNDALECRHCGARDIQGYTMSGLWSMIKFSLVIIFLFGFLDFIDFDPRPGPGKSCLPF